MPKTKEKLQATKSRVGLSKTCADCSCKSKNSCGGAAYFVGFVGAFVYFMQAADSFGSVLSGFAKALVWPAILVYKLLESFYGAV